MNVQCEKSVYEYSGLIVNPGKVYEQCKLQNSCVL